MNEKSKTRKENGMGTIYFDEKRKKWIAEIQWTDRGGEKHKKKFSGQKKTIVKNKLDEFKKELLITNGNIKNKEISFKAFSEYWLKILQTKLKPTSYQRKVVTLENQVFPYLGNMPIDQITNYDVQSMINKLVEQGLSYSTIKKAYEAVNGCIREYRIKTQSTLNPCEGITLPENNQKDISNIIFFNENERKLIIEEATKKYSNGTPVYRLGHMFIVLMYTGMRIGEFLALTWDDINFNEKTININKNAVMIKFEKDNEVSYKYLTQDSTKTRSSNRLIPITQMAYNSLREIQKINGDKNFVLSTKNGKQITHRSINKAFHAILVNTKIAEKYGELCGVHILRHTFATMLFQNGCDVKIVSEILGHSNTKITENIYIHVIHQQKVKAMQNIDQYV